MRITQDRSLIAVTIITGCVLAALWSMGPSTARLKANGGFLRGEAPSLAAPAPGARLRADEAYGKLPLSFEVNHGQTDAQVKFFSRGAGYGLFLISTEAVLSLERSTRTRATHGRGDKESVRTPNDVLRMKMVGANPAPIVEGSDELPGKSNYFIGQESERLAH